MVTKICKNCGLERDSSFFGATGIKKDGTSYCSRICKQCTSAKKAVYYQNNKEHIKKKVSKYRSENIILIREKDRARGKTSIKKASNKKYIENNKKLIISRKHNYYINNKMKIIAKTSAYKKNNRSNYNLNNRNRIKNDPIFKLNQSIRSVIKQSFKGKNKGKESCLKYLPYSFNELKQHIESQFELWMTWENWSKYNSKTWNDEDKSTWVWNIDHIIPQSDFNYTSMEDDSFRMCWALDNLRPYSAKQNILDGASRSRHKGKNI